MACARRILAALGMAAAILGAPAATADPDNLLPWCSGDQTPMDNYCKVAPSQVFTHDDGPGANPETPLGLDPGEPPVIG
ncbi:hypothetical protein [[Mycobacterium] burgundiense]|uniref:Uncharacterized protein n=1 Tax=[Mycobacterium] burgundiense TaxID=3064286 RepID=A0ABM9LD11_9MYCO|nr:hypothetical protein [Mycolicibacterium sp. MU0053]CAJ1496988.1 hypothetical protein MU0053_000793 [Mycolicibacterium sp. MU0053]